MNSLGSEGVEDGIYIRTQLFFCPMIVIGFGGEAGDFAIDIGAFGKFGYLLTPGRELAYF